MYLCEYSLAVVSSWNCADLLNECDPFHHLF